MRFFLYMVGLDFVIHAIMVSEDQKKKTLGT
jgi:hypothetical protein